MPFYRQPKTPRRKAVSDIFDEAFDLQIRENVSHVICWQVIALISHKFHISFLLFVMFLCFVKQRTMTRGEIVDSSIHSFVCVS
jgi:hypothetical protein